MQQLVTPDPIGAIIIAISLALMWASVTLYQQASKIAPKAKQHRPPVQGDWMRRYQDSVFEGAFDAYDHEGFSFMHLAARDGEVHVLSDLLKFGEPADNVTRNQFLARPIHYAASCGRRTALATLLAVPGVDPNAVDSSGSSPLHLAVCAAQLEEAHLLLHSGALVNARDRSGYTPLHAACSMAPHRVISLIAEMLISHGADVNAVAKGQLRPLHIAARTGNVEMIQRLLRRGATIVSYSGEQPSQTNNTASNLEEGGGGGGHHGHSHGAPSSSSMSAAAQQTARMYGLVQFPDSENNNNNNNNNEQIPDMTTNVAPHVRQLLMLAFTNNWRYRYAAALRSGLSITQIIFLFASFANTSIVFLFKIAPILQDKQGLAPVNIAVTCGLVFLVVYARLFRSESGRAKSAASVEEVLVGSDEKPLDKICHICCMVMPPRSWHCKSCQTCVDRHDHHCFWVGRCVGSGNIHLYVSLVIAMSLGTAAFLYYSVMSLNIAAPYASGYIELLMDAWEEQPWIVFSVAYVFIASVVYIFPLALYLIYTAGSNVSMSEFLTSHLDDDYMKDGEWYNPYGRGLISNVLEWLSVLKTAAFSSKPRNF